MYVADKICHPDSPNEDSVAPAARNAVGIKPSAVALERFASASESCTLPRVAYLQWLMEAGWRGLGHFILDEPTLAGYINCRGYC